MKTARNIAYGIRGYKKRRQEFMLAAARFKKEHGYNAIANWTDFMVSEFVVYSLGVTTEKDFPRFKLELFNMASQYFNIEIEGGQEENDKNIGTPPARSSAKRK